MWYFGGKKRQSKQIVTHIRSLSPGLKVYVEPFCGAMWSAVAVLKVFPDVEAHLNDLNPYLMCMWREGVKGWRPPLPNKTTESMHKWYKKHKPIDDPMTAYLGFAWSFAGQFFGTPARGSDGVFKGSYHSTVQKLEILSNSNVKLTNVCFSKMPHVKNALYYLDPPYANRQNQAKSKKDAIRFNREEYLK